MDSIETADKLQPSDSVKIKQTAPTGKKKKRWFPRRRKNVSRKKCFSLIRPWLRERVTATQIGWLVILILLREKHYLVKGGVYLWYPQGGDKVTTPLPYAATRKSKNKTWNITGYSYRSRKLLLCLQDFLKCAI